MDDQDYWMDKLYRETGPHLLLYLARKTGDVQAAEDLMQETFAVAMSCPERIQSASSARAYLFGIARNLAIQAFRNRRQTEPLPCELAIEEPAADPRLELMRQAVRELKSELREVLELRLQHELSYEETARVLGIPIGTVRSRLHHALTQLRSAMR